MTLDPYTLRVVQRYAIKRLKRDKAIYPGVTWPAEGFGFRMIALIDLHLAHLASRRARLRRCYDCRNFVPGDYVTSLPSCHIMGTIASAEDVRQNECGPSGKLWQDKHEEEL